MRGSVVKRGKTYSIVYYMGKDSKGKWVQKWESGFISKKKAEQVLRQRISDIENSFANKLDNSELSIFLLHWLETYCEKQLSRNTVNGYRVNIEKHIIPYIGHIRLLKLQPSDIENLYISLSKENLSNTSILYVHRVLKCALNYAVKKRVINYNVMDYIDAPKKDKFIPYVLNSNEVNRLLLACKDSEIFIPVLLSVTLGLRRGEVLGLMWDDIDWKYQTVHIQRTATCYKNNEFCLSDVKTSNSNRTLCLPKFVLSELEKHFQNQKVQALEFGIGFNVLNLINCRADGSPISTYVLNGQFKKIVKNIGLHSLRFHDLRHTNATLMLKENVPAKIVSTMLGHSSIGITLDTYSHVLTDMQKPAINAINDILKKIC